MTNPIDVTTALAKGARDGGVRIFANLQVTAIHTTASRVTGVETPDTATIDAD